MQLGKFHAGYEYAVLNVTLVYLQEFFQWNEEDTL
jgi:hypothetical protein